MTNGLKKAWDEVLRPMVQRPKRLQVAAICYAEEGAKRKVLLITSRDTGRWVVPKGWPIDGMNASEAARQEAWEEAGVKQGEISPEPVGSFEYEKNMDSGGVAPVETQVFTLRVDQISEEFPEADERTLKWVSPTEAAEMVDEPGLQDLLRQI